MFPAILLPVARLSRTRILILFSFYFSCFSHLSFVDENVISFSWMRWQFCKLNIWNSLFVSVLPERGQFHFKNKNGWGPLMLGIWTAFKRKKSEQRTEKAIGYKNKIMIWQKKKKGDSKGKKLTLNGKSTMKTVSKRMNRETIFRTLFYFFHYVLTNEIHLTFMKSKYFDFIYCALFK